MSSRQLAIRTERPGSTHLHWNQSVSWSPGSPPGASKPLPRGLGLRLAKMVFLTSLAVCALYYAVESTKATRQNSAVHPTTFRSSSK